MAKTSINKQLFKTPIYDVSVQLPSDIQKDKPLYAPNFVVSVPAKFSLLQTKLFTLCIERLQDAIVYMNYTFPKTPESSVFSAKDMITMAMEDNKHGMDHIKKLLTLQVDLSEIVKSNNIPDILEEIEKLRHISIRTSNDFSETNFYKSEFESLGFLRNFDKTINSNVINIHIEPKLLPYLVLYNQSNPLIPSGFFSFYKKISLTKYSCEHTPKFYTFLSKNKNIKTGFCTISKENLYMLFNLEISTLSTKDFNHYYLKRIYQDLYRKSDVYFEYKEIQLTKKGREITDYTFKIIKIDIGKLTPIEIDNTNHNFDLKLFLKEFYVNLCTKFITKHQVRGIGLKEIELLQDKYKNALELILKEQDFPKALKISQEVDFLIKSMKIPTIQDFKQIENLV